MLCHSRPLVILLEGGEGRARATNGGAALPPLLGQTALTSMP